MFRNDGRATIVWSPMTVSKNAWHQVQIRVKVGAGSTDVWFDGQPSPDSVSPRTSGPRGSAG
jgi:hypothetical protein